MSAEAYARLVANLLNSHAALKSSIQALLDHGRTPAQILDLLYSRSERLLQVYIAQEMTARAEIEESYAEDHKEDQTEE